MKLKQLEQQLLDRSPDVKQGYEHGNAITKAGSLLRQLREFNGLTQRQLEAESGVQQAEISRIEKGQATRGMTLSQLETIAHAQNAEIVLAFVQKNDQKTVSSIEIEGRTVLMHTII